MADRILRSEDIYELTGLTERQLRVLEREGKFPKRFKIHEDGRRVGWLASEVDEWIMSRASTRAAA